MVVVLRPGLPPFALLHYRDFDVVCSELGGVCEHVEKASGIKPLHLFYARPQIGHFYLQDVTFEGPFKTLWEAYARGEVPPTFEHWDKKGPCQGLGESCPASPSVFLMPSKKAYTYLRECTSLTKRAREAGVKLWGYTVRKRVKPPVFEFPWELVREVFSVRPIHYQDAANCGLHPLASMLYWAETGGIKSVEALLGRGGGAALRRFTKISTNDGMPTFSKIFVKG
ncbi:hypothetical protein ODS41_09745 [Pyrobaculum sp. 3827-6]|uniref:hypothetical protein n=1 Tax=Pyrobaculum sp. 3827-6 TaxID=2983604 RepID=UPI0021D8607F|nr:hypothetical protein [Pyrobaculum sp. 3827-6]MCU7788191.1 hypothetical protein [Pyrobaculum sp. 3827-6]